mmetsp:Transcript_13207/g.33261  ORF Transcript_13207/g.33261 Transcript_13207/m.33261 type:complete len:325 (-) Transcript_13207:272-1246(-)
MGCHSGTANGHKRRRHLGMDLGEGEHCSRGSDRNSGRSGAKISHIRADESQNLDGVEPTRGNHTESLGKLVGQNQGTDTCGESGNDTDRTELGDNSELGGTRSQLEDSATQSNDGEGLQAVLRNGANNKERNGGGRPGNGEGGSSHETSGNSRDSGSNKTDLGRNTRGQGNGQRQRNGNATDGKTGGDIREQRVLVEHVLPLWNHGLDSEKVKTFIGNSFFGGCLGDRVVFGIVGLCGKVVGCHVNGGEGRVLSKFRSGVGELDRKISSLERLILFLTFQRRKVEDNRVGRIGSGRQRADGVESSSRTLCKNGNSHGGRHGVLE